MTKWKHSIYYADGEFIAPLEKEIEAIDYFGWEIVSAHYDPVRKKTVIIVRQPVTETPADPSVADRP